ncbi:hypothetical protein D3C86_1091940 [compost metagenome]
MARASIFSEAAAKGWETVGVPKAALRSSALFARRIASCTPGLRSPTLNLACSIRDAAGVLPCLASSPARDRRDESSVIFAAASGWPTSLSREARSAMCLEADAYCLTASRFLTLTGTVAPFLRTSAAFLTGAATTGAGAAGALTTGTEGLTVLRTPLAARPASLAVRARFTVLPMLAAGSEMAGPPETKPGSLMTLTGPGCGVRTGLGLATLVAALGMALPTGGLGAATVPAGISATGLSTALPPDAGGLTTGAVGLVRLI